MPSHFLAAVVCLALLAGCTDPETVAKDARVIAIGDSVLAWHGRQGASIVDVVERRTGLAAANLSVPGARITHSSPDKVAQGYDIRAQYTPGPWDWVIVNGGANDLLSECGCRRCGDNLDRLISADGRAGDIPALVRPIAATGTRVMLLGYYDGNVKPNVFTGCGDDIDALNARLALLARATPGIHYVSAGDVIDPADQNHWFIDRVHPSRLGARLIGQHVAAAMQAAE